MILREPKFGRICVLVLMTVLAAFVVVGEGGEKAETFRRLKVADIHGQTIEPFADSATRAVVLVFVSSDCPVANAFQPTLADINNAFASKGVVSIQVHCSSLTSVDEIERHVADYGVTVPVVLDTTQTLGRLAGAKITPEAILVDRTGTVRYRGAINNLYAGFGKKRRVVTAHYLRDAVEAVLAGRSVELPVTKPVGCFIRYAK